MPNVKGSSLPSEQNTPKLQPIAIPTLSKLSGGPTKKQLFAFGL